MRLFWIPALALAALSLAACGGDDSNALKTQVASLQTQVAQAGPDRVVGIEWRCTLNTVETHGADGCPSNPAGTGGSAEVFKTNSGATVMNRRQELTIRTPSGATYTVNVSPDTKVALGDAWPPK